MKILLQNDDDFFFPEADIVTVSNSPSVLQILKETTFDLIILEDLETFKHIKSSHPKTPIVVAAPISSIEQAVQAIQGGALDYIVKPLTLEKLEKILEKAQRAIATPSAVISTLRGRKEAILAESLVMQQVLSDIAKVAQSHAAVFISGESGTGKEVIAHAIHHQSPRASLPFIKVNCAAVPETLIESEFFGHEKGSFTGAIEKRIGRFELAHRGTLLLDEISEIPLTVQAKLLRVVQEQEFERVGGIKPINVDVRLISTSNRSMKEMIEQKQFREDLYFRLNVVPIQLPPLRERKEDILSLADYFLDRFSEENQKRKKELSLSAQKRLLEYPWPGNIRELANTIERAVVMNAGDLIEADHLRLDPSAPALLSVPMAKEITLADLEKQHILETLAACNHNRTRAAKSLGISVRTLRNKLQLYLKK
ncbi:MAG: sigma-54-dependent Fis family transcriptional regulator [Verrucomicrobia bacterium]|nr:sigma-54-dependent Fis family transcriptional regulator [Verrucomicrobiota bacterium]